MSAPQVVAVVPDVNETDVVLGQAISITFDQEIDTTSLSDSTFSLTCPALTQVVTNNQLISGESSPSTIVVHGTWTFNTAPNGATVAVFQPSRGFTPNTSYTATLLGADAALSTEDVHNPAGEPMAQSYSWTFISGALSLKTPPPTSPLLDDHPPIQPGDVRILPRARVGQDLGQQFDIVFPEDIDPASFSMDDLLMSVEPILGSPNIMLPQGLQYSAVVNGNKISVTVTGWTS